MEQREKYRAVFNDQYQEYKDLYKDVSSVLSKFSELDAVMARLVRDGRGPDVREARLHLFSDRKDENDENVK